MSSDRFTGSRRTDEDGAFSIFHFFILGGTSVIYVRKMIRPNLMQFFLASSFHTATVWKPLVDIQQSVSGLYGRLPESRQPANEADESSEVSINRKVSYRMLEGKNK
jgi:hypothetical protein